MAELRFAPQSEETAVFDNDIVALPKIWGTLPD